MNKLIDNCETVQEYWYKSWRNKSKKVIDLKSNWNELKKWLKEMINEIKENDIYDRTEYECTQIATLESTLAKVEEIERL
ncbi:MAG: hypothetical protein E7166_00435 [Firmicutes bacterium]|nr:hypothetical protein [Bacillota bacterium]